MKKRIVSLLLAALLLVSVLPVSVFAADMKITSVGIGGTAAPSLSGNCTYGDLRFVFNTASGAEFGEAYWQEVTQTDEVIKKLITTDVFEAGKCYAFCIWLIPQTGSVFPYAQEATGDMRDFSGTVSADNAPRYTAKVCTAAGANFGKLCVTIYHGEINSGRIGRAAFSVATPVIGTAPSDATSLSAGCHAVKTTWSPADAIFQSGKAYTVTIEAEADGAYEFSNTVFSVNGKPIPVEDQSKKKATLRYTFSALNAPSVDTFYEISSMNLKAGEHADLKVQSSISAEYADKATYQWYRFTDDIENAEIVPGATSATLVVYAEELGGISRRYFCRVRATVGSVIIDSMESGTIQYITISPVEATLPFRDVATNSWFYSYVAYCYHNELMAGVSTTTFSPNTTTSRAMIVTILYRMENSPAVTSANPFADVKDDFWYTDAIRWSFENEIVNGFSKTEFGPNDAITREQFATIMMRYARYKGWYDAADGVKLTGYPDARSVSEWATEAMSWVVGTKLISGMPEDGVDYLNPHGSATRAQAAKIINQFCKNVKDA